MKTRILVSIFGGLLLLLMVMGVPDKTIAQIPYYQSFMGNSVPGLVLGGTPLPFLTAGQTVSYGTGTVTDPTNNGYLRLTPDSSANGYVYNNTAFPARFGLRLSLEYFIYSKSSSIGDGLTFFLFDGATTNFNIGAFGGCMGYLPSVSTGVPGLSNGYLGIGFDIYGNYSSFSGSTFAPNSVAICGDGNNFTGYQYLTGFSPAYPVGSGGNTRRPDSTMTGYRRAIITLEPKVVSGGYSYNISVTIVTGGPIPTYNTIINNYTGFSKVAPAYLKYGFAASTGAAVECHEIRNLKVDAYTQPTGRPVAVADNVNLGCTGATLRVIDVLSNDAPANQPLGFDSTSIRLINPTNPNDTGRSYTIAGVGTFAADSVFGTSGKVYFRPAAGFSGSASIRYVVRDNYTIQSNAAPITVIAEKTEVTATVVPPCNGTATGSVTLNGNTNPAGYTYALGTGAYQSSGTFSGLRSGTYVFHIKNSIGCLRDTSITLNAFPPLVVTVSKTDVACYGGTTGGTAVSVTGGNAPYTYSWNTNPAQATPTASNLTFGTYTVAVTDAKGCTATATATVSQPKAFTATATASGIPCNGGLEGRVDAKVTSGIGEPYSYAWNTSPAQTNQTLRNLDSGTYTVTVTDAKGCTATATTTVVKAYCPPPDTVRVPRICNDAPFYVANTFTPNGDGTDDWFYPQGAGIQITGFTVTNRWGQTVFKRTGMSANDPTAGWDGTFRGEPMDAGVFLYILEVVCTTGEKHLFTGDVSLIR